MQKIEFLAYGVKDRSGNPLKNGYVRVLDRYYAAKAIYSDIAGVIEITTDSDDMVQLDSNGSLQAYVSGVVNIEIYDSNKALVKYLKNLVYQNLFNLADGATELSLQSLNVDNLNLIQNDTNNVTTTLTAVDLQKNAGALPKVGFSENNSTVTFNGTNSISLNNITGSTYSWGANSGTRAGIGTPADSTSTTYKQYGTFFPLATSDAQFNTFAAYHVGQTGHTKTRITFPIISDVTQNGYAYKFPNKFDGGDSGDLGRNTIIIEGLDNKTWFISFPEDNDVGEDDMDHSEGVIADGYASTHVTPLPPDSDWDLRTSIATSERGAYIEVDNAHTAGTFIKIHIMHLTNTQYSAMLRSSTSDGITVESLA